MLEEIFCFVDDFCQEFIPKWKLHLIHSGVRKRHRCKQMSESEVLTILILFHNSHYRNLKHYYIDHVSRHLTNEFPSLVSYSRFVELQKSVLVPLCYLSQMISGQKTGIYFIDSTTIKVCHIKREKQNKVFRNIAKKSKSTMGWFFGFKLHLVINDKGQMMAFKLTCAKTDDRKPVEDLTARLTGKLIGDKGYISKPLSERLIDRNLQLITRAKKNMKNQLMSTYDKLLLRKRAIIETVNDQLKNISQIEHTRHRSVYNFLGNILCALLAYSFKPTKPNIKFNNQNRINSI